MRPPRAEHAWLVADRGRFHPARSRRQVELALERGRRLLESLPYPDNVRNHFQVDPAKYDFYAMDVYRTLGEDAAAEALADDVLRVMLADELAGELMRRHAEEPATRGPVEQVRQASS